MTDFIHDLAMGCAVALTGFIAKKIYTFITQPYPDGTRRFDPETCRKQFFGSLFTLIGCIIAFYLFKHSFARCFSALVGGYAVIFLWGAFDAIYYDLRSLQDEHRKNVTDECRNDRS